VVKWVERDHFRPCVALERSPFFNDVLLSVGDWSFNLWKEGIQKPIFSSPLASAYLTGARWSPTRPGVLIAAKADGTADVWDLTDQSHKPSATMSVASAAITSMRFRSAAGAGGAAARQLLAVGDEAGNLHVLDIPRNLRRRVPNEEQTMRAFFEREVLRVEYVDARGKVRAAEKDSKKAAAPAAADAGLELGEDGAEPEDPAVAERRRDMEAYKKNIEKEEQEYRRLEARFREELGITEDGAAAGAVAEASPDDVLLEDRGDDEGGAF